MAYQTYIGQTTILGVPNIGAVEGYGLFEPIGNVVQDQFQLAEQIDTRGDVVRVTPYRQQHNCEVTFYPMVIIAMTTFPPPMAMVVVTPIADIPCPAVFLGQWRYVGGNIVASNTALLVMRLQLRRWNPYYAGGPTYTPPTDP